MVFNVAVVTAVVLAIALPCHAATNYVKVGDVCIAGPVMKVGVATAKIDVCEGQCGNAQFCIGYTWASAEGTCNLLFPTYNKPYSFVQNSTCSTVLRSDVSYAAPPYYAGYAFVGSATSSLGVDMSAPNCFKAVANIGSASIASYRISTGECLYSLCANMEIVRDADAITYVLGSPILEGDNVPKASHEWIMTDRCGYANTGNIQDPATNLIPFNVNFNLAPNSLFGNATEFQGKLNSYVGATTTSNSLNFGSKFCATFFYYAYANANSPFLAMFTSGTRDMHIYRYPDTVTTWVNFLGSFGAGKWVSDFGAAYSTGTAMAINTWKHEAFCFDSGASTVSFFEDGKLLKTNTWNNPTAFQQWNQILLAKDPDTNWVWSGRMYCVKLFDRFLTEAEMQNVRQSCLVGKLRRRS